MLLSFKKGQRNDSYRPASEPCNCKIRAKGRHDMFEHGEGGAPNVPDRDPTLESGDITAFAITLAISIQHLGMRTFYAVGFSISLVLLRHLLRYRRMLRAARNFTRYEKAYHRLSKTPNRGPDDPTPVQIHPLLDAWRIECCKCGLMVSNVSGWQQVPHLKGHRFQVTNRKMQFSRMMRGLFLESVPETPGCFERWILGGEDPVTTWRDLHDRELRLHDDPAPSRQSEHGVAS